MDRWLNNAPALTYIKDLSTWLIINNRCEPILWCDDDKELAWLFACILECGANNTTRPVLKRSLSQVSGNRALPSSIRGRIVSSIRI
jgi:hypothetical protein